MLIVLNGNLLSRFIILINDSEKYLWGKDEKELTLEWKTPKICCEKSLEAFYSDRVPFA